MGKSVAHLPMKATFTRSQDARMLQQFEANPQPMSLNVKKKKKMVDKNTSTNILFTALVCL